MGRSENIGWGISNYFGIPNRKRKLLTVEFLTDFRDELIKRDTKYRNEHNYDYEIDYNKESYMGFYGQIAGTVMFYESLKEICAKHNLTKAIYQYANKMSWYDSDCFEDDLVLEMVKKGVIEYECGDYYSYDDGFTIKYKLVKHHKGYNIVKYGNWFEDGKDSLEDIYEDSTWELTWL